MTKFRSVQSELYVRKWVEASAGLRWIHLWEENQNKVFLREAKHEIHIAQCKSMNVHAVSQRGSSKL